MISPKPTLFNTKTAHIIGLIGSACLIYLVISLIYFGPSSITYLSSHIFNNSTDPEQFIWYYNWWPFAIIHHLNPFISYYVWYPKGYNLAWSTSIPTLSLLMLPVTLLGGAVLSYNLIAILSPVLAATAAFMLLYYLTKQYLPSLIAGYIYGFSSFVLAQLLGHPQQYAIFLLPLALLAYLMLVQKRLKPLHFIMLSVVLLLLQTGISLETTMTFMLFSALTWGAFYCQKAYRQILKPTIKYLLYTFSAYLVVLSPFIYYLLAGLKNLPNTIHPMTAFSLNVANLFIPTPISLIGGHSFAPISHYFIGNIAENGAYMGLPLLLILLYLTIKYWKNTLLKTLVICLIIIGIAAIGPRLHLIGQTGASFWMPWAIVSHLPLIDAAQPDRFSVYFFLITAVLIGWWLSMKTKTNSKRQLKLLLSFIAIIFLIPNTNSYAWPKPILPNSFQPQNVKRYLANKPNIFILPLDASGIYYQYATKMSFTQAAGYAGFVPRDYVKNPVIVELRYNQLTNNFVTQFKLFVKQNDITKVIIIKAVTPSQQISAIKSLGWPTIDLGDSLIISVKK